MEVEFEKEVLEKSRRSRRVVDAVGDKERARDKASGWRKEQGFEH